MSNLSVNGSRSSLVVERPHCNDKDVDSNPTTARNENQTLGASPPPTEGSPRVWTGSEWKTGDVKAELDL